MRDLLRGRRVEGAVRLPPQDFHPTAREPPTLGDAMRMVAKIGGFLGRKGDGHPGATVLWHGLDKLAFITDTLRIFHPAPPSGP